MKKICFVVTSPFIANAFLYNHIKVLQSKFDVYLVTNFNEELGALSLPHLDGHHTKDIKIERQISIISDLKALLTLRKYFKQEGFDAVHSVSPKAGLLAMAAAKLAGVKNRNHTFTGQVWFTKKGVMKKLLMTFDKIIGKLATEVLVDGRSQREFLIENKIIKADDSQILGKGSISGVDTSRFVPDVSVRKQMRNELTFADTDIVFCFLGRINVDKGVLDLAQAFNKVVKHYPDIKLLMIGYDEGNLRPLLEQLTGNSDRLIFYGGTPKPEIVLQAADVVCLPSYREGFGTSVIEASLLALPIICSDTYGLMDTIIENETGLRHKVGDVDSLANAMEKMAASPELRSYQGRNGRKYVLENFPADVISNHWLNFYNIQLK